MCHGRASPTGKASFGKELSTSSLPRSVISANVRLALRCRSIFSENTSVLRARSGSPEKKSVSPRWLSSSQLPRAVEVISIELHTHMLEILEQIRDGLPLAFGQNGFVKSIAGLACLHSASAMLTTVRHECIPPQHDWQAPMVMG